MKEKATLILGGGSALGLAHIGVLSVLEEQYEITGIIGSSMGSIIGGLYSSGLNSEEIYKIAKSFKNTRIFSPLNLDRTIQGIFDGKSLLKAFLEWTEGKKIEEGKIPFIACAYDLISKSTVLFNKGLYADAMRASTSLPVLFAPYKFKQYLFIDGGIEHPLPLAFSSVLSQDKVIAVNVLPEAQKSACFINLESDETSQIKRLSRTEIIFDAVLQNQAYLAIRDIATFSPDIVIEAGMAEGHPFAFHKAMDFYNYGRLKALETLANYKEPRFITSIRKHYRNLIRYLPNLNIPVKDNT
jgi:NTE family protein